MISELKSAVAKEEATSARTDGPVSGYDRAAAKAKSKLYTAGLQKVSARLELNKPAPQRVTDNQ